MYIIISFTYEDTLTSVFLIYILFFLSFNSIAVRLPVLYQRGDGRVDSCVLFFVSIILSPKQEIYLIYLSLKIQESL